MADRLIIFEDNTFANFFPLTLSRPIFELRCGAFSLWEKIAGKFPGYDIAFACRDELAGLVEAGNGKTVNSLEYNEGDRLVFVNGRLRLGDKLATELKTCTRNQMFNQDKVNAAIVITSGLKNVPGETLRFTGEEAASALGTEVDMVEGEFEFYSYLWDLVNYNANEIGVDYLSMADNIDFGRMIDDAKIDSSARILSKENLYIAPGAEIAACAVIDNRHGPVIIDSEARVGPLSYIEGPCYVGKGSQIFRGNIREGCSFGPVCRVGGEVEESIFQGFTNKYHDGFVGHAYLGSWVNLGAMTTNSDLKNNYKNITVSLNGELIDTGSNKIGSYIGDHSKTGIGTLLNTGISIGFSCNIYGGNLVTSREVESFSWGDEKGYDVYRVDKAIEVARMVMSRREVEFTSHDEKLFQMIYEKATVNR